jgi:predicted membrane channel-forming protein YqfA (hemolysin III family)
MPCYLEEGNHRYRVLFYLVVMAFCFSVTLAWVFYATRIEMDDFFATCLEGFFYLGCGFIFYFFKWPESQFNNYYV